MSFKNIEIWKKANIYNGGKVTSRTMISADGEMKTLGIMQPGTYRFSTDAPETMEITQGNCRVKLADEQNWNEYSAGESFEVPGNSNFEIEVSELLDYVCHIASTGSE